MNGELHYCVECENPTRSRSRVCKRCQKQIEREESEGINSDERSAGVWDYEHVDHEMDDFDPGPEPQFRV